MLVTTTWKSGPLNNQTLAKNNVACRYNEIIEVPKGAYDPIGQTIPGTIIFQTKLKHRIGTLRAYINNQEIVITEANGAGYSKGYHFMLPATMPVGYLIVKYYPSLETNWLSDNKVAGSYFICDNRPAPVVRSVIADIRTNINLLEAEIATNTNLNAKLLNKPIYYEDRLSLLDDFTKVQLTVYQKTINGIRDAILATDPSIRISYTFSTLDTNLLKSEYISEIRFAINTLRDVLNAEN